MTIPRLAAWTYHCDEQDADYDVQLLYEVHPAERSCGITRNIELIAVQEVVCGHVTIEGLPVKLTPGEWERRVQSRIEKRLARSETLREQAESACWRDLDEFNERLIA